MEWMARFLREQGHKARISIELEPDLGDCDVVHLFNLTRPYETFIQAENARAHSKPYVLSSVYWDLDSAVPWNAYEFPRNWWRRVVPEAWRRTGRKSSRAGLDVRLGDADPHRLQAAVLSGAACVFPNSQAEKAHLLDRFTGLSEDRLHVVLNGIESTSVATKPPPDYADGAFVCAGAIGPRKNQLNLAKAFRRLPDERLVLLGATAPNCERYRRAVARKAGPNVILHDRIPHGEMRSILGGAKCLVQPSFIETPGLSAMEAAAVGVPIVVADVPPVREYFGERAHYCRPDSPSSIAAACCEAAAADRRSGADFAKRYDWMEVLKPLGRAYAELESSFEKKA